LLRVEANPFEFGSGFSVIIAQLRLGIVTWFQDAVLASGPDLLSNKFSRVSSVLSSRWCNLFLRARRFAIAYIDVRKLGFGGDLVSLQKVEAC
jgi:hypothetical protein